MAASLHYSSAREQIVESVRQIGANAAMSEEGILTVCSVFCPSRYSHKSRALWCAADVSSLRHRPRYACVVQPWQRTK
jgi:hypothetical protein